MMRKYRFYKYNEERLDYHLKLFHIGEHFYLHSTCVNSTIIHYKYYKSIIALYNLCYRYYATLQVLMKRKITFDISIFIFN